MTSSFEPLQEDFLRITGKTVFCTATTVDEEGRPRSRMLHPVFVVRHGRPIGWALTGRTPLKTRHLAANPHMSCSYWSPSHDTVFVDCAATWVDDDSEKEQVWDLFLNTPEPLGWGPGGMAGYGEERWRNPVFTPLRLDPWRVQVMRGEEYPRGELTGRVWRGEADR
jgi:Pyridoxamine 5'-phosphate oxidase